MPLEDCEVRNCKPCQNEKKHRMDWNRLAWGKKNESRRGWAAVFKYLKEKPIKAGTDVVCSSRTGRIKRDEKGARRQNRAHPTPPPKIIF